MTVFATYKGLPCGKEKNLIGLYIDRVDRPDMTGAVVKGKVERVLSGQKAAWVDCGLEEKVYFESKQPIKTGDRLVLQVQTTWQDHKAWVGKKVTEHEGEGGVLKGIIKPAPHVWVRATADYADEKLTYLFSNSDDYKVFLQDGGERSSASMAQQDAVFDRADEVCEQLLLPTVPLAQGGHLVIEKTEALVAIDVNGGLSRNPLATNCSAVQEVLRQVRLRNLAGIIVIDCLKMKQRTDHATLLNSAKKAAASDPAGTQVFGMTKLGLMEISRPRRGPSLGSIWES